MSTQSATEIWYITGSSSGLGKAIAEQVLLRESAVVYGYSRKQTIQHVRYHHHFIDLSDRQAVQQITFDEAIATAKNIILINNAGALGEIEHTGNLSNAVIAETYQLNTVTPHILSNIFLKSFGHLSGINKCIINVTSGAATAAYDGWSVYCASKAAINMLTEVLAKEQALLPANIASRVYALAPGVMDTPMQQQIRRTAVESFSKKDKFVGLHKNQQLYNVQNVAEVYINLALNINPAPETIQRVVL